MLLPQGSLYGRILVYISQGSLYVRILVYIPPPREYRRGYGYFGSHGYCVSVFKSALSGVSTSPNRSARYPENKYSPLDASEPNSQID